MTAEGNDTNGIAIEGEGTADISISSSGTQTRFSFYNAQDYQVSNSKDHSLQNNDTHEHPSKKAQQQQPDSVEILRSLQEHEQQRLDILGAPMTSRSAPDHGSTNSFAREALSTTSNPYEDAIKEALDLLRRHRGPPTPHHSSTTPQPLSSPTPSTHSESVLGEAYQAEIEARRKQRQQRMARYATRLAELKQTTTTTATANNDDDHTPATTTTTDVHVNSPATVASTTTPSTTVAPIHSTYNTSSESTLQMMTAPTSSSNDAEVQRGVERVLLAILERANTTTSPDEEEKKLDHHHHPTRTETVPSTAQEKKDNALLLAMSELLQQPSEAEELDRMVERIFDDNDENNNMQESGSQSPDEYTASEEEEDSLERDDDDDDEASYDDDDDDASRGPENRVLGPLGGKTGVVLDSSSSSDVSEKEPSIFEAALNLVTGRDTKEVSSDEESSSEDSSSDDDKSDTSIQELTRTLCAHLYPREFDDYKELQGRIPKWDEGNSDELGYRIIRLNSIQLETVQQEYEHSIKAWKKKLGTDESFERDLQEAEALLEEEERRVNASTSSVAEPTPTTPVANDETPGSSLEHFPYVKAAGKGEMGDMEYFQLPIIFKSHVTGFEPTKDIHLEPGNVIAGQYLVEGELGSAAFSTAYRCVDLASEGDGPDDHEEVCLKVIKNTKDFFDQSLDEIKILELLRQTGKCHENHILEMKTFFYHREHLMIVTELLRQNLFEFGKFIVDNDEEPYFTISRLGFVTRQALIALNFVHKIGLVHSDVKPENILLSSYSRAQVKLIDFGSSCYLTDRQSSYIQSRSYRAPEVVLGLPYDGRIDIWSLGCVVAEMYTGEVTFQNDSVVSMLSRIEAICGNFPRHMIEQGRQSAAFFTRTGLLFEKVDPEKSRSYSTDDEDDDKHRIGSSYDLFQPKRTSLAARLGFEKDLMEKYDKNKGSMSREQRRKGQFVDFVRSLLTIDPEKRPTAEEALSHPWMEFAASLTEEDIKYPSS